jgi:hypothetical protein
MYHKNDKHYQLPLISSLNELPDKLRERLEESWAGTFYREFFCRLDEAPFAVLYSSEASRPNVPINVLVGLEVLKAGFGWSDEEMYDAFCYNLQVRYALGYRNLDEGHFELRTVYNFRRRLTEHMRQTGENLLEQAFEQVTGEQLEQLKVKTGKLRMDSTQVMSNIRQMSRLQLLVEMVQRLVRVMSEADRARYGLELGPYLKGSSGQYVYRVKSEEKHTHLQELGQVMHHLVEGLAADYADNDAYRLFKRVFEEHYILEADGLRLKTGKEIGSATIQSPDDLEATYRRAKGKPARGYLANVAETCDPDNEVQLIVSVQVAANNRDDAALLAEGLPDLHARTGFDTLYTDGNYNSPEVDELLRQKQACLIQTGIRGGHPDPERLGLDCFVWEQDEKGWPDQVACPWGQRVAVRRSTDDHFLAYFDQAVCADCPLKEACPTRPLKRQARCSLYIKKRAFFSALRQQARQAQKATGRNPRAAVEATVRSLKHPFRQGKLPVRGQPRMSMMMLASATMTNIRRIWQYETRKREDEDTPDPLSFSWLFDRFLAFIPGWQPLGANSLFDATLA